MKPSRFIARRVYRGPLPSPYEWKSHSRHILVSHLAQLPGYPQKRGQGAEGPRGIKERRGRPRRISKGRGTRRHDERPKAASRRQPVLARASGGTSRYCRSNFAISWKTGAATIPPKIAPRGSSTVTRITSRGLLAGTNPTNDAMYRVLEYPPQGFGFAAVPVFPATS